jgi:hypothetical protein
MSDSLLKITLNPDLDKLSGYISKPMIARYQKTGVYLESTMTEAYYAGIYANLIKIFEENNLLEHTDELLYIILAEDEILSDSMLDAEMNYQDIQNAIEVSNFLLAFKRAENNPNFQLGVKENIGTIYKPKTESAYVRNAYFTNSDPSISVQSGRQMDCRVIQYCSFPSEQIPTTPPNCFLGSAIYQIIYPGLINSPKPDPLDTSSYEISKNAI